MYPLDLTLSLPCWFNSWDLTVSPDFTWAIGFIEMFLPVLGEGRDHCFREQHWRLPGFMVRIFFCSSVIGSKECLRPFFVCCQIWWGLKQEDVLSMMEWWRGFQDGLYRGAVGKIDLAASCFLHCVRILKLTFIWFAGGLCVINRAISWCAGR